MSSASATYHRVLPMSLLPGPNLQMLHRVITASSSRCFGLRYAHAAVAPESSSNAEAVIASRRSSKGKSREHDYVFPVKGRHGGPPDPFDILGVERSASADEIKQQYYRLALLLHPDSSHPSSSHEHFAALNRAYTILSRPSARASFLQTGAGWTESTQDDRMRAEIRFRRHAGAGDWHGRSRFRPSDAGSGAWGYSHHNNDRHWQSHETGEHHATGKGEERYMSNPQLFGLVGAISLALSWMQYQRFLSAKDTHTALHDKQHLDASRALAEARSEAALFGRERRERIRRRVRESEVISEVEQLKKAHDASLV